VPVGQRHGVAAIIQNDTRIAGRSKADGVHVETGFADLKAAVEALRPGRIVGAGGLASRHEAMLAGEADPDYVFFGRLDGDYGDEIAERAMGLAEWWAGIFHIPAIVMGGKALESIAAARDAGVEFVALRSAVWEYPAGPRAAVAEANRLLSVGERVT
jgi:thiamine-phosphate pyrophosphorylase